jgi:hypothetical protein
LEDVAVKRLLAFAMLVTPLILGLNPAWARQDKKSTDQQRSSGSANQLPLPNYKIPMDLSAWKQNFAIVKITYKEDDNQIVFLLKAKRNFTFKDDGYDAPFAFLDQDGVNLVSSKNLTWEHEPKGLRMGESTRATLQVPDEETLQKTKKAKAVVKGFFNK